MASGCRVRNSRIVVSTSGIMWRLVMGGSCRSQEDFGKVLSVKASAGVLHERIWRYTLGGSGRLE